MGLAEVLKFLNDLQLQQGVFHSRQNTSQVLQQIHASQNPHERLPAEDCSLNLFAFIQFCLQIAHFNFRTSPEQRPQEYMTALCVAIKKRLDPWSQLHKSFAHFV